jgi:hypothetical protein
MITALIFQADLQSAASHNSALWVWWGDRAAWSELHREGAMVQLFAGRAFMPSDISSEMAEYFLKWKPHIAS